MNSEELNLGVIERLKIAKNSYMSKKELLTILERINFIAIERCNIDLITNFVYDSSADKITNRTKNIIIN